MSGTPSRISIRVGGPVAFAVREPAAAEAAQRYRSPLVDIYEGVEGLILEADLPGVKEENLVIQVEDHVLTLQARVTPVGGEESVLVHQEFEEGVYQRSFILSDEVDREQIRAEWKGGVLRLILPKAEKPPARRIEVRSS